MRQKKIFGFPQNVFVLSIVSFLNDIGGETIKRALPLYLANVLGVRATAIGLIEGIADATPQLLQPVSGFLSDRFGRRKPLIVAGEVLRSSMVLLFGATTWPQALLLRFMDRGGKGITNAPRDALISASADRRKVGAAFGLNRALDNAGAVIGLGLAGLIVGLTGNGIMHMTRGLFQTIVLLAGIPLIIAVVLLSIGIHDVGREKKLTVSFHDGLGKKYYLFLFVSFLFALGNSSDAFLILKAQREGMGLANIFFLLAAYSAVPALMGYPLSKLSDRIGRKRLLVSGWLIYAVVYFLFAINGKPSTVPFLFLLYGMYYACTEGSAKALVSDLVPSARRGTAFGLYNMVVGATLFPASLIAGYLWETIAPAAPLFVGGITATISVIGLLFIL